MDLAANIKKTEDFIREAAAKGAQVILPSELFQGPYFCVAQEERWFAQAHPWREHPVVKAIAPLAGELGVVIPISIFEREGPHYFNSLVMVDADGSAAWASTARATSPTAPATWRSTTSGPATPASRSGTPASAASASASAGTSGTPRPPAPWP